MKMVFRWFGEKDDPIKIEHIRQIPGVSGVVSSLLTVPAGDVWTMSALEPLFNRVKAADLELEVIESVNVHEDIKLGRPTRDAKIDNYIETMRNLSKFGVKVICYNFMPVLDWARSELFHALPDGSDTMYYDPAQIDGITPDELAARYARESGKYEMPGWEPERLKTMKETLAAYAALSVDDIWDNMRYFLDAIIPVAEETGILMAIHPDDPPWPIFGLPRLIIDRLSIRRFLDLNKSVHNGLTLCTGSLGASPLNDVPAIVREFAAEGRVHFAHIRNLKFTGNGAFYESAHKTSEGSLDMKAIVKAFADANFNGYIRPDHGRMIWGEVGRPGYGLFDRALGAAYINGLWEGLKD